jgi:hypothetical protein
VKTVEELKVVLEEAPKVGKLDYVAFTLARKGRKLYRAELKQNEKQQVQKEVAQSSKNVEKVQGWRSEIKEGNRDILQYWIRK